MRREPLFSIRNPWFTTSIAVTGALALAAGLAGMIWFPLLQDSARYASLWDAICSAAGIVSHPAPEPVVQARFPTTQVVVTPQMLAHPNPQSIGRGATLALRCTMCHGARGLSQADSPNLAGQYASVIYKELKDFASGARQSAVMAPLVAQLSEQDMRDLAAYYAYLPRPAAYHPAIAGTSPRIVLSGAPMRNIAPCGACHGSLDTKVGASWLEGQPGSYIKTQLLAFASGARHNDIDEQMRNVARRMTAEEIDQAARYYATQP